MPGVIAASRAGFALRVVAGPGQEAERSSYGRAGPGSSERQVRLLALAREPLLPLLRFRSTVWLLSGSAWQKQTWGRKELTKGPAQGGGGHRAEQRSLPPLSLCSLQPMLLPAHLLRKAQGKAGSRRAGPGAQLGRGLTRGSSTVLCCLHHSLGDHCFCLLPSRLISPHQGTWTSSKTLLQGATCWAAEDVWTMAV